MSGWIWDFFKNGFSFGFIIIVLDDCDYIVLFNLLFLIYVNKGIMFNFLVIRIVYKFVVSCL